MPIGGVILIVMGLISALMIRSAKVQEKRDPEKIHRMWSIPCDANNCGKMP